VAALMSTTLACAFILIQLIKTSLSGSDSFRGVDDDYAARADDDVAGGSVTFGSFSLSFATILFSFGGASTFPTIQNDMKDKGKFYVSVLMCFSSECSKCEIRMIRTACWKNAQVLMLFLKNKNK
jgi:amino acid permease